MDPELQALLDKAKGHVMTPKEQYEQMISFVYGMQKLSAPGLTHDEIKAMLELHGVYDPDKLVAHG